MKDFLLELANSSGLKRITDQIERFLQPTLRLVHSPGDDAEEGRSRFGGLPDLPPHVAWPSRGSEPLDFLAQIRCEEIAPFRFPGFPAAGVLSFFYDIESSPWGVRPRDRENFAIIYSPDALLLRRTRLPFQTRRRIVRPAPIHFVETVSLPSLASAEINDLDLTPAERDAYFDLLVAADTALIPGPFHQLFGHPKLFHQGVGIDCELGSSGVNLGDPCLVDAVRAAALASRAAEWLLLLQIDSDPELGLSFGNNGLLSFWIRKSDPPALDFCPWVIIQSP